MMSPVCLIFLAFPLASALTFNMGPCPTPSYQANFNLSQYLGRWYEIESLSTLQSILGKGRCSEVIFDQRSNGDTSVRASQIVNNEVVSMEGSVYQDPEEPAKMELSYYYFVRTPWLVLSTDYSSVAVVYHCWDFLGFIHVDYAWITSRTRSLDPDAVIKAKKMLTDLGINTSEMMVADQTGCEEDEG